MAKRKQKMKRLDHGGYSLVELMVVIVIMVILASVSIGVYNGYVNRARSAVFYEKGHRIAEAFKICEAEHGLSGEFDKREMAEEIGNIMKKPRSSESCPERHHHRCPDAGEAFQYAALRTGYRIPRICLCA